MQSVGKTELSISASLTADPESWGHSMDDDTTYEIRRFHFRGGFEVVQTGLTLEEAREHCQRDDTRGDGWFDGYTEES